MSRARGVANRTVGRRQRVALTPGARVSEPCELGAPAGISWQASAHSALFAGADANPCTPRRRSARRPRNCVLRRTAVEGWRDAEHVRGSRYLDGSRCCRRRARPSASTSTATATSGISSIMPGSGSSVSGPPHPRLACSGRRVVDATNICSRKESITWLSHNSSASSSTVSKS